MTAETVLALTERAAARIREIAVRDGVPLSEQFLRVAVIPGGCSGLTYELGWDTTRQEGDHEAELDGITVVMDRRSFLYVEGTTLDFTDGLEGQGFHFNNPQATRTCACGESFSL
jgi:iron-sulfur cluster assembly protein